MTDIPPGTPDNMTTPLTSWAATSTVTDLPSGGPESESFATSSPCARTRTRASRSHRYEYPTHTSHGRHRYGDPTHTGRGSGRWRDHGWTEKWRYHSWANYYPTATAVSGQDTDVDT
jgi:hypothetical protein